MFQVRFEPTRITLLTALRKPTGIDFTRAPEKLSMARSQDFVACRIVALEEPWRRGSDRAMTPEARTRVVSLSVIHYE